MSKIKIDLLPEDFKGWKRATKIRKQRLFGSDTTCPLGNAIIRRFPNNHFDFGYTSISIYGKLYGIIKDGFYFEDAEYVWEKYQADPKAEKVIYQVTLESYN